MIDEYKMTTISTLNIEGKELFVEVDSEPYAQKSKSERFRPEGSELTGITEKTVNAAQVIENTISGISNAIVSALKHSAPDECEIELSISFKGENHPIPVIVKLSGEGSIRVKVKWKKQS